MLLKCPVCNNADTSLLDSIQRGPLAGREFWHCANCQLIHVPAGFHLEADAEKAIYDLHDNSPDDDGYRRFLSRLFTPLAAQLPAGSCGLDFGSGPEPVLARLFQAAGFACATYDLYYDNAPERLQQRYDFIVSTEVFEHLAAPAQVFQQLLTCLKPNGRFGIMTQRWDTEARFKQWTYRNDPTHICFFHEQTFQWLAQKFGLQLTIYPRDVVIFQHTGSD